MHLVEAQSDLHWREARRLVAEYGASLNLDLSFQNFSSEIEALSREYGPPAGAFRLAGEGNVFVGCVGLRRFCEDAGEIKRLYVAPAARGRRIGRVLAESILADARRLGYARVLLDTLPFMPEARALYLSLGFRSVAAYRYNPVTGTEFMELMLA